MTSPLSCSGSLCPCCPRNSFPRPPRMPLAAVGYLDGTLAIYDLSTQSLRHKCQHEVWGGLPGGWACCFHVPLAGGFLDYPTGEGCA